MLSEPQTNRPWSPSVDIYETENELVLKADLPDVELEGHRRSRRKPDPDHRRRAQVRAGQEYGKGYHRIERSYGNFVRSFAVPNTFDTEKIGAAFKNGVLTVSFPRRKPPSRARSKSK